MPIPNILIVDDLEENLYLLETLIRKFDVNLIRALSGAEALQKTKGMKLALAILDIQMNNMNGYELSVKLNEEHLNEKIPVIFLTSKYADEHDIFRGYDLGAVDFIQKPINNYILQCKIKIFIDLFQQREKILMDAVALKEIADKLNLTNSTLKEKEDDLQKSLEQLQQLSRHTQKVLENERKSISRELHDEMGQALTAVKIDLGLIKQNSPNITNVGKLDNVIALVGDTIKSVRRLTSALRPEIIDDIGLEAAIEWYANEFAKRNNIDLTFDMDNKIEFSIDTSLIIYRITQEALTNISKHAHATQVQIGLGRIDESVHFMIADNGIGINEQNINTENSFGILGMKERASFLGGTFTIVKPSEGGTLIKLIFPLIQALQFASIIYADQFFL